MVRPKYKALYLAELNHHSQTASRAEFLDRKMRRFRSALSVWGKEELDSVGEEGVISLQPHKFTAVEAYFEHIARWEGQEAESGFNALSYKGRPIINKKEE